MSYTPNQEKLLIGQNGGLVTAGGLVAGNLIGIRKFTSGTNATYTPTEGTRLIYVEMCGGGGGSGAMVTSYVTPAGQAGTSQPGMGGFTIKALVKVTTNTGTFTVGSGGSGGQTPSGQRNGTSGNPSILEISGETLTAGGGVFGAGTTELNASSMWKVTLVDNYILAPVSGGANLLYGEAIKPDASISTTAVLSGNIFYSCNGSSCTPLSKKYMPAFSGFLGSIRQNQLIITGSNFASQHDGFIPSYYYGAGGFPIAAGGINVSLPGQAGANGVIFIWEYA